jgi:hypothetical protein
VTILLGLLLLAQAAEVKPAEPQGELPPAATIHARKRVSPDLRNVEGKLIGAGDRILADDLVDEIVDEFAADVARLGAARVGPILIERVRVSDNVNPAYAAVLESRLAAAVFRAASVAVVRCVECTATRSRVEHGEWVVSRGITSREDAQAIARKYGARSFLDVSLNVTRQPASMGMDVEMVRAEDSSIAFAEFYRMDTTQGTLYRGADRAQAREEKLKELQDRLNQRPRWAQSVEFGMMWLLGGSASIWGGVGRFQFVEQFGNDREYQAGVNLAGFLNTSNLSGAFVTGVVQTRLGEPSLLASQAWLGAEGGAFITGSGSAPIVGANLRFLVGERISLHFALRYLWDLKVPNSTAIYGGISPEAGVGFVWN